MSYVTENQPDGTPTWIDLGIPDLDRAMEFYRALFGWEFAVGPAESGHYTMCLLHGRPVAAIMPNPDQDATDFWWNMYFATADCDGTAKRIADAGGSVLTAPMDVMDQGRVAIARDPVGAQFGLWQGRAHIGCQVVNEPGSLVRNDLVTPAAEPARRFYAAVFGYTLERNEDMPDLDFTFLRRPDGHEVAGILGDPSGSSSRWTTTFEVADTDAAVERAGAAGGKATTPEDMQYARMATITDPFGTEFSVGARPDTPPGR
jgi:predicted enzyme related to lactoylglutathione lyase